MGYIALEPICAICLLCCLEHVFKCRHSICDFCVRTFGLTRITEEHSFTFADGTYCGKSADLLVRLKPPTAGLRLLSVDGGAIKGIVPLEFLNLIQKSLGSSCRVQDLFDLAITSL